MVRKIFKRSAVIAFSVVCIWVSCIPAMASEAESDMLPEESKEDAYQNERLNSLELRLEEMGYSINEVKEAIEKVQTSELEQEEERLAISEKLDLVIIALNDLINHDIELLEKLENEELIASEYRETLLADIKAVSETEKEQVLNTVSGNALISDFNQSFEDIMASTSEASVEEFNKTLADTNQLLGYLFVAILFLLVISVCVIIGALLHGITKKYIV